MPSRTILIADDEAQLRRSYREGLEMAGYRILEAGTADRAVELFDDGFPDLVILDIRLPDRDGVEVLEILKRRRPELAVIMVTGFGQVGSAVRALHLGAYDYLEKPIKLDHLLHCVKNALEASDLRAEAERRTREQESNFAVDRIIGESAAMREVRELVRRIAESEADTVLVQGDSGTGKELVAKALHYDSRRRSRPFRVINCAAVPATLMESELFGHEKGAFTGAQTMKKGLFEVAEEGTLFFDELAEMELALQPKLLRVLEDRSFRRVGGVHGLQADVRVICATNRDLETEARAGRFRLDLYYRVSAIPITIPALRQRREDILPLSEHFLSEYAARYGKRIEGFSTRAVAALEAYSWPGNVRELRNVIERAVILRAGGRIGVSDLQLRVIGRHGPAAGLAAGLVPEIPDQGIDLAQLEEELVRRALEKAEGNKTRAARLLSISRDTLRYKVKKYRLS